MGYSVKNNARLSQKEGLTTSWKERNVFWRPERTARAGGDPCGPVVRGRDQLNALGVAVRI